jgi:hypothetical protein
MKIYEIKSVSRGLEHITVENRNGNLFINIPSPCTLDFVAFYDAMQSVIVYLPPEGFSGAIGRRARKIKLGEAAYAKETPTL